MDYTLKKIDAGWWRRFKTACAAEGCTMRAKIIELISEYINGYENH